MTVLYGILAVAFVFAIAAVVIGREARRLDSVPPQPTFDLEDAVEWVADHLPFEVTAVLSHDDVRQIIDWNLEYFRLKGVSGNGHSPLGAGPVIVGGAETVDYVLTRAQAAGLSFSPVHVHAVLDAQMDYLEVIGAIGPEASPGETS